MMPIFSSKPDAGTLKKQAKAVFTGCLIAMAAVLAYGAYLDTKEELKAKAEGEDEDFFDDEDWDDLDLED